METLIDWIWLPWIKPVLLAVELVITVTIGYYCFLLGTTWKEKDEWLVRHTLIPFCRCFKKD